MGVCVSSIHQEGITSSESNDGIPHHLSNNNNNPLSNVLMDALPDSMEQPTASYVSSSTSGGYESSEAESEASSSVGNGSGSATGRGRFVVLHSFENVNIVGHSEPDSVIIRRYVAFDRLLGSTCYVKDIRSNHHMIPAAIRNEIEALKLCVGYPGIVQLIEVKEKPPHKVRIVTEFIDGDTWGSSSSSSSSKKLTLPQIRNILHDILRTLHFMHDELKIAHMDITPEKVMILRGAPRGGPTDAPYAKLIDLRYVLKCGDGHRLTRSIAGTWEYCSPEKLRNVAPYCPKAADVWACGMTALVSIFGGGGGGGGGERHRNGCVPIVPKLLPDGVTSTPLLLGDLLRSMLDPDPANRPTAAALLGHEFFSVRSKKMSN